MNININIDTKVLEINGDGLEKYTWLGGSI